MKPAEIANFINEHNICVISTIGSDGSPEAAVVGLVLHDNFKITIGTSSQTRKYANLLQNPHVAVVVGWDRGITVQYEGLAHLLEGDELARYHAERLAKRPSTAKFEALPTERYFLIEPTWLRYADYTHDSDRVTELTF